MLRGYDKGQVEALLVTAAGRYRAAMQPRDGGGGEVHLEGAVLDEITHFQFDDALLGYDKEDVRSFLQAIADDVRALIEAEGSPDGQKLEPPSEVHQTTPGDDAERAIVGRTARGVDSAIRAVAQREADQMRATAAAEVARALGARKEAERARAAAAEDRAVAAALRAQAEREVSDLRAEAGTVAQRAVRELAAARALRAQAEAAAAEAASELVTATELRDEVRLRLAAVDKELKRARSVKVEAEQNAVKTRAAAAKEADAAAREMKKAVTLRAQAESLRRQADLDARAGAEAANRRAREITQAALVEAQATAALLSDLVQGLEALRSAGSEKLAEVVRGLEDQILVALGETQEEFLLSAGYGLAQVSAAEQRAKDIVKRLADGAP